MKIGLASRDWSNTGEDDQGKRVWGGSGWYRLGLPGKHLRAQGFDVVEGTLTWSNDLKVFGVREWPTYWQDEDDEELHHFDLDLVVLQRWMFASVAVETATARRSGQVVIQDVDDHFWALDPANAAYWTTDPRVSKIENRDLYLEGLKEASLVTVSTPYLADELRRRGVHRERLVVIPNHVEVEAFAQVAATRPPRPSPVLGWVGATTHRSGDLETLKGLLGPFLDRHDLTVFHGGCQKPGAFAEMTKVDPARVVEAPMAPIETYPDLFAHLDVGLVPLRDVAFNRAKSYVKGLEYAAAGLPFVAQDLPEYVRLATGRGIGLLAHRTRDWIRWLDRLQDPGFRAEEGARNQDAVVRLDIGFGLPLWRDVWMGALAAA